MKFGPTPVKDAKGAILAHSLHEAGVNLRKGRILSSADIAALEQANIKYVTVAMLETGDIPEDTAALLLANKLVPDPEAANLRFSETFTGRINILANKAGIIKIEAKIVEAFNAVCDDITVATLPDMTRVAAGAMIATIKIIPYAVSKKSIEMVSGNAAFHLAPAVIKTASLILTKTNGMAQKLLDKAQKAVEHRLDSLGISLLNVAIVPHEIPALGQAIASAKSDLSLILTGSATSDINDVGPAALVQSGGKLIRFGMPVDPGNLLFLGEFKGKPVIGLPGCARSPALNGADWVLERIASGLSVSAQDIARMGVGGLLKEIPTRPQPRVGITSAKSKPRIEIILLAAGGSNRMRGGDKLLELVAGEPLLRHSAKVALAADADSVRVVLQPDNPARNAVLDGLAVNRIMSINWQEGMAASIRAAVATLPSDCNAVIIALADMPDITSDHFNALIAAFDPAKNHEICRAVTGDGTPGLPVLFGRRFFETLGGLHGDRGARDVIKAAGEYLCDVPTKGQGAVVDLDTPEQWAAWHKSRQ